MTGTPYVAQVFPIGANALAQPAQPVTEGAAGAENEEAVAVVEEEVTETVIPEETVQEARRSEQQLDRPAREALQIALEWFGFYNSGIGRRLRARNAQRHCRPGKTDRGFEPTGVLTTAPAGHSLLEEYRGELAALGMETVTGRAGRPSRISLPLAMVEFDDYNLSLRSDLPPVGDSGPCRSLLISPVSGDSAYTLFGL